MVTTEILLASILLNAHTHTHIYIHTSFAILRVKILSISASSPPPAIVVPFLRVHSLNGPNERSIEHIVKEKEKKRKKMNVFVPELLSYLRPMSRPEWGLKAPILLRGYGAQVSGGIHWPAGGGGRAVSPLKQI